MQLNPSKDFYDDGDVTYEDYPDDDQYESDEDMADISEILLEAKHLRQQMYEGDDMSNEPSQDDVDMGYDEDDERFSAPKPKVSSSRQNTRLFDSEGSGSHIHHVHKHHYQNTKDHKGRIDKYQRKPSKIMSDIYVGVGRGGEAEVDLRESSGNFANDDEDNDDDSDDDDINDEGSEGFFNSNRKSNGRYFRKNTNDAIKIISTPLGKVGIVYEQSPNQGDEKPSENNDKKKTTFTDFDALSPDPESSHRLASSHPKITPVLTPDGKVALLYRGDSENTKYEPIRNLTTHQFIHKQTSFTDNIDKKSNSGDTASISDLDDDVVANTENGNAFSLKITTTEGGSQAEILQAPDVEPTTGSFIIRPTDSVLPMINRPLSEVLGIKKNQFKQFRIKDAQATPTTEIMTKNLLEGVHPDATTLHFMTKVNLADYPTSSITRSRNFDFDFSRDNTMLDERSRHRQEQQVKDLLSETNRSPINYANNQKKVEDIANDEVLSKTEVVNLAIIPHFDDELERLQRLREYEGRRHYRQRHRNKQSEEDLSGIHCIMQVMMGIAAVSTVFGMLGTFFKQRILDQIRLMHW